MRQHWRLEAQRFRGYKVIGFPHAGWHNFDALHCRTRAVFDPGMLRLTASRYVPRKHQGDGAYLSVRIHDYSGEGLVETANYLNWRYRGESTWRRVQLKTSLPELYLGYLPVPANGGSVE